MAFDLNTFNRYISQNKSVIAKALTTATGVGAALIPQSLQKVVTNAVVLLSPEIQMMEPRQVTSKTAEFNRMSTLPIPGGSMGESAVTRASNSKFTRDSVTLKNYRRKGQVTNFLIDTARELVDAYAIETENQIRAQVYDINEAALFGNKDANVYECDGYEKFITTNRVNKGRSGLVPTSLKELDDLIDATNRKGASNLKRYFTMSPELLSLFTRLETTVRKNIAISGTGGQWGEITIPGGHRLETYRGIPIIQSTWTKPIEKMSPTVTPAADNKAGSLSNGVYYFNVAPITRNGEQEASTETNVTLSGGGGAQSIKITLSGPHLTSAVENVYAYKIYAGTSTGVTSLIDIVPAYTYDADGTITGYNGVAGSDFSVLSLTKTAAVTTAMSADVPLVANASIVPEVCGLICVDPIQGIGDTPFANVQGDMFNGLITMKQLAETDDYKQFLVKSYFAITNAFEATSAWVRGWKTA